MAKKKATKKTAKKKTTKKAAPVMEMVLVGSKVKEALRAQDVNVGEGTLDALNEMVHWHLTQAAQRAQANGRKTTRPHDVMLSEM